MTVVGHSTYMHTHTHTHTHTCTCTHTHTHTHAHKHTHSHTSGNLLTDGIYCAGEETVPQPASGTAGRGGQGVEKPKRGGARTTLKVTTYSSTVKERASGGSRGLTGKDASTSDDSGGSLFLHPHTQTHTHTRTNMHTHIHTSGNLLTDCIYCAGEETAPQPASGTADRGVKKPKGGGARTTLKATTNSSTLKERAGVRSRGLTGKGASTSNDSGGSLFLHAHTHIRTHTYTHTYTHTHTHTHTHAHAHAHTHTHACTRIHTSGNLLTDGIYFAGEETVPQPASGTAGRGGQGVEKPKRGGARTTLKATTNLSTVKERAGVRSRGLTGKGTSTSNDSGESLFLHAHTHIRTHTYTHTRTRIHTSGNLLTDGIYFAGEETVPQPASGTAGRGGQGVEKPKRGGARTTLKVTTNLSTVKERAGVRSRGLTGKGTSTSNDSSGSLFLHAHAHTHTHTYTHTHTHTHMHMQTHTHTHAHAYTQVAICSLMVSIVQEKRLSLSLHQTPLAEEAKGLRSPNVVVPGPHSKSRPTHPL